jgi:hypothetical protein
VNHTIIPYLSLLCFNTTNASSYVFPCITFHFIEPNGNGTTKFVLAPHNFLFVYLEPRLYCLTILSILVSVVPTSIIGNIAQANHQMVFDQVHHQIGWASTDYSKLKIFNRGVNIHVITKLWITAFMDW